MRMTEREREDEEGGFATSPRTKGVLCIYTCLFHGIPHLVLPLPYSKVVFNNSVKYNHYIQLRNI